MTASKLTRMSFSKNRGLPLYFHPPITHRWVMSYSCNQTHHQQQQNSAVSKPKRKQRRPGIMEERAVAQERCSQCNPTITPRALCDMHLRIEEMRCMARNRGLAVPARQYMERMLQSCLRNGFRCPHCQQEMGWWQKSSGASVVTLQHNRDGGMQLLCLRCNSRHYKFKGDSFYGFEATHKWCTPCGRLLELHLFANRKSVCRKCTKLKRAALRGELL